MKKAAIIDGARPMLFRPQSRLQHGFSLIELLITLGVLTIVLASLSRIMLVENRLTLQSGRDLSIRDSLNQVNQLLRSEIALGSRVSATTTSAMINTSEYKACLSDPAPAFVIIGPNDSWWIFYGIRDVTAAEKTSEWYGPAVLVRCGKPFSSTVGDIDVDGPLTKTVALDRLVSGTGFSASAASGTYASKSATIALTVQSDAGKSLSSSITTGIGANSIYDRSSLCATASSCTARTGSSLESSDYRESYKIFDDGFALAITADASKEVVVYFPSTTLSSSILAGCTTASCKVGVITVKNASLLVFADGTEIRVPVQ